MHTHTLTKTLPLLAAAGLTLSACGDDASAAVKDGVLGVTMDDFHYGDLPDEIPAGTRIEVSNASERELHEFVAVRLADDDERAVEDVVADLDSLFSGMPAAVLLAPPDSSEQIVAVGDGTLSEPGRYVVLCMIPTGADPNTYLTAAEGAEDGPPEVDGGAPHVMNGMFAELTVTG